MNEVLFMENKTQPKNPGENILDFILNFVMKTKMWKAQQTVRAIAPGKVTQNGAFGGTRPL